MRVVFLCPKFYPQIGGVEKHSFEIARRLVRKNHKVTVVTESYDKDRKEVISGVKIIRLHFGESGWLKKFRIWYKILKIKKTIQKGDIVHCHDVFFWYLPLSFIFPKKRVYITFHGFESIPPTNKAIFIRKLSEKLSNGNICIGDYIKKWYGTKSNIVSYGAVDKVNIKSHKPSKKIKFVFLGRTDKDTGVKSYTTFLEYLKKLKINFEVDFIGDGDLRKEFEKYGKVHGFVKKFEKILDNSDILLASSYLSILEGLIRKKVVVAIYENELKKDYLTMAPFAKWIIIDSSPKRAADKVKLILKNTEVRNSTKQQGYVWAKGETWDKIVNQYLILWQKST